MYTCIATKDGEVALCAVTTSAAAETGGDGDTAGVAPVAIFRALPPDDGGPVSTQHTYTAGALHPDGLIYVAGTTTGAVHVWDFRNKSLASTLFFKADESAAEVADAVTNMDFSNNGYHAVGYASV
jgi:WD40 repeat protein